MSAEISIYNTASKKVETFVPLTPGVARIYCCGPTVYHYVHIGNLRTFIFEDLLRRTLDYAGYAVQHIVNITDVGFGGIGNFNATFGSLGVGVTSDFIKETQVKTAGFEAEYGQSTGGVVNVVTQSGSSVSAEVQRLARAALDAITGGHVFTGDVDGADVSATIVGDRASSQGACAYTIDADLEATLDGDNLSGSVFYRARTNGAADCGALTGCASQQDLAGARPPQ